jgi:hypothetical protein
MTGLSVQCQCVDSGFGQLQRRSHRRDGRRCFLVLVEHRLLLLLLLCRPGFSLGRPLKPHAVVLRCSSLAHWLLLNHVHVVWAG